MVNNAKKSAYNKKDIFIILNPSSNPHPKKAHHRKSFLPADFLSYKKIIFLTQMCHYHKIKRY